MPTRCEDCFCYRHNAEYDYAYCNISSVNVRGHGNARLVSCPLVPVPDHGRLIDADALTDALELTDWYHQGENKNMVHGANSAEHQAWYKAQDVYAVVDAAPTIIQTDEKDGAE